MLATTEGYGFLYNKDILDKASIDPKFLDYFDKLKAAFETLDSKKAESGLDQEEKFLLIQQVCRLHGIIRIT